MTISSAAVVGLGLLVPAASADAAPTTSCWAGALTDVDGGGPDVVVGLPGYDLPGRPDAGAIAVFSNVAAQGSPAPQRPKRAAVLTADDFDGLNSQAGARFGAAVTAWLDAGDQDDPDSCADLLVGAPGQTVLGHRGAGQVYVLKGSAAGLGTLQRTYDENLLAGPDGPEPGDGFGSAIVAQTGAIIGIGAPGRDVGGVPDAGRVVTLDFSVAVDNPRIDVVEQSGAGDAGSEPGDRFGQVLDLMSTRDGNVLVVGVPREDVGSVVDAGAVVMVPPTGQLSMMTQNRRNAGGRAEAGDRYGAALTHWWTYLDGPTAVLAIGVPGEDVVGRADAGMVSFANFALGEDPGQMTGLRGMPETLTQGAPRIPGVIEAGDEYGGSLVAGEIGTDDGRTHLAVGSPTEGLGRVRNAGLVSMTRFETDASPRTGRQPAVWTQDSAGVAGAAEAGDRFGARMTAVQLTTADDDEDVVWAVTLVVVPREDVGGVRDVGMAYLGVAPGVGSIRLVLPVRQAGAGIGMVPMQLFYGT